MLGLDEIYDAGFDRARFPRLIERLVQSFDAQAGFIAWSDPDRGAGFQTQFGNDPVWLRAYLETFAQHDILRPHLHAVPEGVCTTVWPLLQTPDIRASRFYREFLAPQGIIDNLAVNLIKRPGLIANVALLRRSPSEPFGANECDALTALIPHLRRAIYIQSHLVRAADHAAGNRASAGDANTSVVLLAADRSVIEVEPPLAALLRFRTGDRLRDGPIGNAVDAAIDRGEPVALAVPGDADGAPIGILIEVRALEMDRFGDLAGEAGATHALHVTRIDRPRTLAYGAIGRFYGLTAMELRVLRDAMEAADITGIGKRLGMASATARTHLHRIYEKTETRGFAGLSNLAHRFGQIVPP